ncbi:MAG: AsnC family transcriptional regulator [Candidatus Woesearchaeota archaeon]
MRGYKLDLKDMKILYELEQDPKITLSKLAKNVKISRQVADYRINKLKQHAIYAFYPIIDVGRLGYSVFRIHLRIKSSSKEVHQKFAKELFKEYKTFWVAFMSGSFDIIVDIFAKTPNEFEETLAKIIQKNKEIIQNYETFPILSLTLYDYGYFLEKKQEKKTHTIQKNLENMKLDEIDKKIIDIIKYDYKTPYIKIGQRVDLSRNAVKHRIKNLEKNKIIAGYKVFVNFEIFNKQAFKIFITYDNSKIEQEKGLLNYLKSIKGVLATLKLLGKWNLDIEIQSENVRELQDFLIELRTKFDIIESYEIAQIIEDFKIDFHPDKL